MRSCNCVSTSLISLFLLRQSAVCRVLELQRSTLRISNGKAARIADGPFLSRLLVVLTSRRTQTEPAKVRLSLRSGQRVLASNSHCLASRLLRLHVDGLATRCVCSDSLEPSGRFLFPSCFTS